MDTTNFLRLKILNPNVTNWGETINSNFQKIDSSYNTLNNSITNLKLGSNYLYFIKDRENVIWGRKLWNSKEDELDTNFFFATNATSWEELREVIKGTVVDTNIGYTIYRNPDYKDPEINTEEGNEPEILVTESNLTYLSIPDYTAFYIVENNEALKDNNPPYTDTWVPGELMVATSSINKTNFSREFNFLHFKQVIGGFYEPSYTLNSETIIFKRKIAFDAPDQVPIDFPNRYINGVWSSIIELNQASYILTQETNKNAWPNCIVDAYEEIEESNGVVKYTKILLDYSFVFDDSIGKWKIVWEVPSDFFENKKFFIKYAQFGEKGIEESPIVPEA